VSTLEALGLAILIALGLVLFVGWWLSKGSE
jgi:hypothetical protein